MRHWECTVTCTVCVQADSPDEAMDRAEMYLPAVLTDMLEKGHVVIVPLTPPQTLPAASEADHD